VQFFHQKCLCENYFPNIVTKLENFLPLIFWYILFVIAKFWNYLFIYVVPAWNSTLFTKWICILILNLNVFSCVIIKGCFIILIYINIFYTILGQFNNSYNISNETLEFVYSINKYIFPNNVLYCTFYRFQMKHLFIPWDIVLEGISKYTCKFVKLNDTL